MFGECEEMPQSCRLLELGAGMGICGIFGACLGLDAIITDNSETLAELARHNVDLNSSLYRSLKPPTVALLDWEVVNLQPDSRERYELVVAAGDSHKASTVHSLLAAT